MSQKSFKFAAVAAAGLALSGAASALTLDTTGLKADSVLTFTVSAFGSATAAGITFQPFGNMTSLPDATVIDPETETETTVPVFNQPITKATVSIGWDLKITPVSGLAARSGLKLNRTVGSTYNWAAVANFDVQFGEQKLYADIITPEGTTKRAVLYTFKDNKDTKISLKGLVLNMSGSIQDLIFSQVAQDTLASALKLSAPLKATLATQNWGKIDIKVTSYKRTPKLSDVPLTAADVPAAN